MSEHNFLKDDVELMEEYNFIRNKDIDLNKLTCGSAKTIWWTCKKCKGDYEMPISWRTCEKRHGCPYCSGRRILKGYNDFESQKRDYLKYWDYEKNEIKPSEISGSSHKEVYWKCPDCFGEWKMSVNRLTTQKGCPYCSGRRVLKGFNDLQSNAPELIKEWSYEKNTNIKLDEVTVGSGQIVWWKCPNCFNHYKAKIYDRTRTDGKKSSCPYCSGNVVIKGHNDLKSQYPNLIEEWNYERNTDINPDELGKYSTRKVWWKCKNCGHEWITTPENRARDNNGCPKCNSRVHTSFPEQALFFYIKKCYPDAINSYKEIFDTGMELDIYIPSRKIAFEYDGHRWHYGKKTSNSEHKKYEICKQNGIRLIRIVEKEIKELSTICDDYVISEYIPFRYKTINSAIIETIKLLGEKFKIDVDADRDAAEIQKLYLNIRREKSFLAIYPELKKQWNYEKNKDLNPDFFTPRSSTMVWWICPVCGKDFEQRIRERTRSLGGCQKCARKNINVQKVVEVETGRVFNSQNELSAYLKLSPSYTSHIIRNNVEIHGMHYSKIKE